MIARASPLHATIVMAQPRFAEISDVRAIVTLANDGDAPLRVRTEFLRTGSLALEVRDATGSPVHAGPPPVPTVDDGVRGWQTLAPHGSMTFECNPAIAVAASPGRFELRFRGVPGEQPNGDVVSAWVPFTIASP